MNAADKTDLNNLLSGLKTMKKLAEDMNAPYHDEKVSRYARSAIADAIETKDFVLSFIRENLPLLVNLSDIRVGGGFWGYEAVNLLNSEREVWVGINKDLSVRLAFRNYKLLPGSSTREVHISANHEDVAVLDVKVSTPDTSRPEYDICSWDDLYYNSKGKFYNLERQNANGWKSLYYMAVRTRAYSTWLVRSLKESVSFIAGVHKSTASELEKTKAELGEVGVYEKVTI